MIVRYKDMWSNWYYDFRGWYKYRPHEIFVHLNNYPLKKKFYVGGYYDDIVIPLLIKLER